MTNNNDNLAIARATRSSEKLESVSSALTRMLAEGTKISVSSVSRSAGVSRSYLYSRHLRAMVEAAISQQVAAPNRRTASAYRVSKADFDLVLNENTSLKEQIKKLSSALSQKVGKEIDARELGGLSERLKLLEDENGALILKLKSAREYSDRLDSEREELSEQLAASRALVQRMMRGLN